MKKVIFAFLILMVVLFPLYSFCQTKLDEAKHRLTGSWIFGHLYTLGNYEAGEEKDGCIKAGVYNFKEDGTVLIENKDTSICKYANTTMKWSVALMQDNRGKTHYAVQIVQDGTGENVLYDGNTFAGNIYMLVSFKKNFFTWIPKPPYKVPNANSDVQYFYRRVKS